MTVRFASSFTKGQARVSFFFADTQEEAEEFIYAANEVESVQCRFLKPTAQNMSENGKVPMNVWVIRKEECL